MVYIEMMVGVGGIWVHPLWMDAMEEVVQMGGLRVHQLRIHGIINIIEVGDDEPPRAVKVMEAPLSWSKVTQKLWLGA
jgi:hypothetical protein